MKGDRKKTEAPLLVVSDPQGHIFEVPGLLAAGMSLNGPVLPAPRDFIPLPYGSNLYLLPDRLPVGYDPRAGRFVTLEEYAGKPVLAVAAFMAPAYLQLHRSAWQSRPSAERLALYSYSAAGWRGDRFVAAGMRIDPDERQDLRHVHLPEIERQARLTLGRHPGNRLVEHLVENCVFRYGCPAARNFVLGRWECPVPTSRTCNSRCLGCISLQPGRSRVCASQARIAFRPEVREVVELAVPHLENAPRAVISFGQGCEGEPLMEGELLEEAIREIRRRTARGIVNLNTNASRPATVERLCRAGLDSIRVSLNSARPGPYERYYKPRDYGLEDVVESLRVVRRHGRWASINYLTFPGFTDQPAEMEALEALIGETRLNMIQTRNLNIDPEWYLAELGPYGEGPEGGAGLGMREWVGRLRRRFPWLKLGYFNPPREEMKEEHFRFAEAASGSFTADHRSRIWEKEG